MKKKLIVLCLVPMLLSGLITPHVYAGEGKPLFYTFDNFISSDDGTLPPSGFGMPGKKAYVSDTEEYAGVWSADLGGGNKALELRANKAGNFGSGFSVSADEYTDTQEISVSFYLNDYNIRRYFGVYDCNHYGNEFMQIRESNGKIFFLGEDTGFSALLKTWYDVKVTYNLNTKLGKCELFKDGVKVASTIKVKDIYAASAYGGIGVKKDISNVYVMHGKENAHFTGAIDNPASSYWDNIGLRKTAELIYPLCEVYDFDSAQGDDIAPPDGLTFVGAEKGKTFLSSYELDGEKVLKYTALGNKISGLEKTFGQSLSGKFVIMAQLTAQDLTSKRFFAVKSDMPLLVLDGESGKISIGDNILADFEVGKTYNVLLEVDSGAGKAKASIEQNGAKFSGELDISDKSFERLAFYINGTDENSVTFIDNLGFYSVGAFDAQISSHINKDGRVNKNEKLLVKFSNPLKSIPNVSLDGASVDSSLLSLNKENELELDISGLLDFDKQYTLLIDGAEDIFGNILSKSIDIKTVHGKEISDIFFTEKSGRVNASVNIIIHDAEPVNLIFGVAVYAEDGEMTAFNSVQYTSDIVLKTPAVDAAMPQGGYAEAFLIDRDTLMSYAKKQCIGNAPDCNESPLGEGVSFISSQADGRVTASGLGIGKKECCFAVLKPGKTRTDFENNPNDSVCHIKVFGNEYEKDGYFFPLKGFDGQFNVLYKSGETSEYIENAFTFYSETAINRVLGLVNAKIINPEEVLKSENAQPLSINTEDYFALGEKPHENIWRYVTQARSKLDGGKFAAIAEFANAYSRALLIQSINEADSGNMVLRLLEKYKRYVNIEEAEGYKTFKTLSDNLKNKVYSAISEGKNYSDVSDVFDAFNDCMICTAIANAENSIDVKSIITENNSWLLIDLSNYLALKNPYVVNDIIAGKSYKSAEEFKKDFENEAKKAYDAEKSHGSGKGSGGSAGSGSSGGDINVSFAPTNDFEKYSNRFKDMDSAPWARNAVGYLFAKGIVNGKTDDTFAPDDNITREEFAKLLVCAFGKNDSSARAEFSDIPADAWYSSYVATAVRVGIVKGRSAAVFGSGEFISRQDMAVMAARAAGVTQINADSPFKDYKDISDYAKGFVSALSERDIIKGKANNIFAPHETATRAESAVIIYRLLEMRGE